MGLLRIILTFSFFKEETQDLPTYTERLARVAAKYNLPDGAVRDIGAIMRDLGAEVPIDPRTVPARSYSHPAQLSGDFSCQSGSMSECIEWGRSCRQHAMATLAASITEIWNAYLIFLFIINYLDIDYKFKGDLC